MIEIERKFALIDVGASEELRSNSGATVIAELNFTDDYFDNEAFLLTLNNCWPRQRNGKWELKYDANKLSTTLSDDSNSLSYCTKYTEVDNDADIISALYAVLKNTSNLDTSKKVEEDESKKENDQRKGPKKSSTSLDTTHTSIAQQITAGANCNSLESFLKEYRCAVFAKIITKRKSYEVDGVRIDMDVTESGYQGLELEVMVDNLSDTDYAEKKINTLAEMLGTKI